MANIGNLRVILSFEVHDAARKRVLEAYLEDELGAEPFGVATYEFEYRPPPTWRQIITRICRIIDTDEDRVFMWDVEMRRLRRLSVHEMGNL